MTSDIKTRFRLRPSSSGFNALQWIRLASSFIETCVERILQGTKVHPLECQVCPGLQSHIPTISCFFFIPKVLTDHGSSLSISCDRVQEDAFGVRCNCRNCFGFQNFSLEAAILKRVSRLAERRMRAGAGDIGHELKQGSLRKEIAGARRWAGTFQAKVFTSVIILA